MRLFKTNPFLLIGVCLLALGGLVLGGTQFLSDRTTEVSDTIVEVGRFSFEIADTKAEHERGLSGRAEIPDHYGMLFVLPEERVPGFWMQEMLIPIDIIWLSASGEVVGVEYSVSPDTYPTVFYPPVPVLYVLETRAGYAKDNNWEPGMVISLPNLK